LQIILVKNISIKYIRNIRGWRSVCQRTAINY
jgi:hypothetical protein